MSGSEGPRCCCSIARTAGERMRARGGIAAAAARAGAAAKGTTPPPRDSGTAEDGTGAEAAPLPLPQLHTPRTREPAGERLLAPLAPCVAAAAAKIDSRLCVAADAAAARRSPTLCAASRSTCCAESRAPLTLWECPSETRRGRRPLLRAPAEAASDPRAPEDRCCCGGGAAWGREAEARACERRRGAAAGAAAEDTSASIRGR